jgi:hypothetical protein
MRRTARALLMLVATGLVAAAVVATPASATTTYRLAGVETSASDEIGVFAGTLVGQFGAWQATIDHGPLAKDPSDTTSITDGTFTIKALGSPRIDGTHVTGTLTAQTPVGKFFCSQQFVVSGGVFAVGTSTGYFGGTLTHYGTMSAGVCNAVFATFTGWAST